MTPDSFFLFVADDTRDPPVMHVLVFNDETDASMGWNVACCGESLDDYALVSFENTDAGYPIRHLCGRCFEHFGADVQRALNANP